MFGSTKRPGMRGTNSANLGGLGCSGCRGNVTQIGDYIAVGDTEGMTLQQQEAVDAAALVMPGAGVVNTVAQMATAAQLAQPQPMSTKTKLVIAGGVAAAAWFLFFRKGS